MLSQEYWLFPVKAKWSNFRRAPRQGCIMCNFTRSWFVLWGNEKQPDWNTEPRTQGTFLMKGHRKNTDLSCVREMGWGMQCCGQDCSRSPEMSLREMVKDVSQGLLEDERHEDLTGLQIPIQAAMRQQHSVSRCASLKLIPSILRLIYLPADPPTLHLTVISVYQNRAGCLCGQWTTPSPFCHVQAVSLYRSM